MLSYIATRRKGSNFAHRISRITKDGSCPATYSSVRSIQPTKYCIDNKPIDIKSVKISSSFLGSNHRLLTTWENETTSQEKYNTKCKNDNHDNQQETSSNS
mmetsp:Transcript_22602/g.32365  ORF Transcript_22602/g.32365 Transcript_22602/m.32365 type:complete len:101 (+) Transcript_22602:99-401(+)